MTGTASSWLNKVPASTEVLRELQEAVGQLPTSYLDLLRHGNGGEVEMQVNPYRLCLDTAESALSYWRSGAYTANDVFVFGGNGGGSLLAFGLKSSEKLPVVCFDPIDPEGSMTVVSVDFTEFLSLCGGRDGSQETPSK